jgi:hypothetical protein
MLFVSGENSRYVVRDRGMSKSRSVIERLKDGGSRIVESCSPYTPLCVRAAGDLDAGTQDYEYLLESPNESLVLMEFLLDPVKLKNYMLANCEEMLETTSLGKITAGIYYVKTNMTSLSARHGYKICADKAGAWNQYHLCAILPVCVAISLTVAHLDALQRVKKVGVLT